MHIIINHTSMTPIYEQIVSQIRADIINGDMAPGTALPSVRMLSRELKISALTVKKAYDALEEEGVVGSDVAEALYDDGGILRVDMLGLEQFKNAGCDAESRCRGAAL